MIERYKKAVRILWVGEGAAYFLRATLHLSARPL